MIIQNQTFYVEAIESHQPKTGRCIFRMIGVHGNEQLPDIGTPFQYKTYLETPTCCPFGVYLAWKWPMPLGPKEPGWCEGVRTQGATIWKRITECPSCGAPLPEPGMAAKTSGRLYILKLLKQRLARRIKAEQQKARFISIDEALNGKIEPKLNIFSTQMTTEVFNC